MGNHLRTNYYSGKIITVNDEEFVIFCNQRLPEGQETTLEEIAILKSKGVFDESEDELEAFYSLLEYRDKEALGLEYMFEAARERGAEQRHQERLARRKAEEEQEKKEREERKRMDSRERGLRFRTNNPEYMSKYLRQYRKENQEKFVVYSKRYRDKRKLESLNIGENGKR